MTKQNNRHVTSSELAAHLGATLDEVERGTAITVTRNGVPIATLSPVTLDVDADVLAREEPAHWGATTAQPASALARMFGGGSQRAVLRVFIQDPTTRTYQREIARRAGVGLRSAQIALDSLERSGLLESERDGNRRYYTAVRSERFETLRAMLGREFGFPEVIARHLADSGLEIRWAFVFGSAASGDDAVGSDIDLLVVGEASEDDLVEPIAAAQRELGREIDVVSYRPGTFAKRRAQQNHFLSAILAKPRIDVIGSVDDA